MTDDGPPEEDPKTDIKLEEVWKPSGVFTVKGKAHFYSRKSCCCLGDTVLFRKFCVAVMVNKWFDRFITFCIVINSGLLASKDYRENYDTSYDSPWNAMLETLDLVFTAIYLVECIIKIVGMGFYKHRKSYLKDAWNWIDFIIVVISIVSLTPLAHQDSLKVFRSARVLRPLRSINSL